MGLNKVMLIGNLGQDPELRHTNNGTAVCNFSVATNETWTDKDGERQERVEWHRIVAWQKLAEICSEYLAKGRSVYVEGKLQANKWEDRDGNERTTTEIVAAVVQFLGGADGEAGGSEGGRGRGESGGGSRGSSRESGSRGSSRESGSRGSSRESGSRSKRGGRNPGGSRSAPNPRHDDDDIPF